LKTYFVFKLEELIPGIVVTRVELQAYNGLEFGLEKRGVSPNTLLFAQATYSGSCGDATKQIKDIFNNDSGRITCNGNNVATW
jgi:hypothetical protein